MPECVEVVVLKMGYLFYVFLLLTMLGTIFVINRQQHLEALPSTEMLPPPISSDSNVAEASLQPGNVNSDGYKVPANGCNENAYSTSSYNGNAYPLNGYNGHVSPTNGYNGNVSPINAYNGSTYPVNGYHGGAYPVNGYNGNGYHSNGYNSNGYSSNGYSASGYSSNGYSGNRQSSKGHATRRRFLPPTPSGEEALYLAIWWLFILNTNCK